jgi:hypothetical protein
VILIAHSDSRVDLQSIQTKAMFSQKINQAFDSCTAKHTQSGKSKS